MLIFSVWLFTLSSLIIMRRFIMKSQVPDYMPNAFAAQGVNTKNLIYAIHTDMTKDGNFADVYTAIDNKNMYILYGEEKVVKVSGAKRIVSVYEAQKIETYPLEELGELKSEKLLSTARLNSIVSKDDKTDETILLLFSVGYTVYIEKLIKAVKNIRDGSDPLKDILLDDELFCPKCGVRYPEPDRKVAVTVVGGMMVINGEISFGNFMTFLAYLSMLYGPLEFMSWVSNWWARCVDAAQRVFEIIDSKADIQEPENPVRLDELKGNIEVNDVWFEYDPATPVLKGLSMSVEAGSMLGIVGKTGAGKSTLANLIARLYDVNEGSIIVDGVNVKQLPLTQLRKNIGIVSQDIYLFIGSIADNIRYAKPEASIEDVIRAAKAASAHDFIINLPDGYETKVGAGGQDLSGGEKQRLSIARTIIQNPKILILDEATAAMDTETEGKIQHSLSQLQSGRTTIAIAHRLSTLRDADKLAVINDGKVVETGTHDELMVKKGGIFMDSAAGKSGSIEKIDVGLMDMNNAEFYTTKGGFTGLKYGGKDYSHITLRRALPVSQPMDYISIADHENKEIGIIRSVSELKDSQREIVEKELNNRYYCPEVYEIKSVKDKLGYVYMELRIGSQRDKSFTKSCAVKDVNRNIRMLNETSLIIFDVDGNRYIVKSLSELDKNSLKRLEPYLF
ncbi:atp-dependent permease mdl1 mitochondrial [Holotrichia oblita]|nr:atp-dependent permease mdl1 mitochondrial [Holotrichia oblita]